ncbi:hypothetical protein [Sorangium sp. So ce1000]|uniref:hypothetical protein n=1 Tax=Sorangium sp. So ce1000 TaxID=3133325 RepID=UPI003F6171F1
MIRQSIRSSKSLALSVALGVIAAAGFAGCGASEEPPVVDDAVEHERVTQADVAKALETNEFLSLDMSRDTVYALDYSGGAIDYTRIKLSTADGKEILLSEQMAAVEQRDYGDYPAPVLTQASDDRFSISSDEAAFGKLSESELDQLKVDGFFYSDKPASSPSAKPQSTDPDCVHAYCEVCTDNTTGGRPETWLPGTFTCYLIEHVWC